MDAQSALFIALAVSVLALVAVLAFALLSITRNVELMTKRLDESLRQFARMAIRPASSRPHSRTVATKDCGSSP